MHLETTEMVQKYHKDEVPDFLLNSPFLPIGTTTHTTEPSKPHQSRPTLFQIIKSKPTRTAFSALIGLVIMLLFRRYLNSIHFWSRVWGPRCYFTEPVTIDTYYVDQVDWSKFAYMQYATNKDYLCNSVMMFETLSVFGTKANKVLLYPNTWNLDGEWQGDGNGELERRLLKKGRDEYDVTLTPIQVQHQNLAKFAGHNWASSYTKLLAFNQTQYSRVLMLDSDSSLLQPLDELFLLPEAPAILPRAYWIDQPTLSSHIMLLTPSSSSFSKIRKVIPKGRPGFYDMEIINSIFGSSCLVLPHRKYALLSGEFRSVEHSAYLGPTEEWDPTRAMDEAKMVHFSDHPLGKPWEASVEDLEALRPACVKREGKDDDCRAQELWLDLYMDFKSKRKVSTLTLELRGARILMR